MKFYLLQPFRLAIAANRVSAEGSPAAVDILFNFPRLMARVACGFTFRFIAGNGRRPFPWGDGLNLSGKLPGAGRRRNRSAPEIAPIWRRGREFAPSLQFQKPVFALARRFAAAFNMAAHFCPDALAGRRGGLMCVLRAVRLEPDCPK